MLSQELLPRERAPNLFVATPEASFQVGHSNKSNAITPAAEEIELVRLRPTTLHSKKPTCFIHVDDEKAPSLSNNNRAIVCKIKFVKIFERFIKLWYLQNEIVIEHRGFEAFWL